VRSRLIAAGAAAAALALAGCTDQAEEPAALPPVRVVEQPAASSGGACVLWDYAFIEDQIGVRFTVAAGQTVDKTSTCVVQTENGTAPFLVYSVVDDTAANAEIFTESITPDKATKVKGLGQAGYQLLGKAAKDLGPSIEVTWLSEAEQMQSLKFTFAKGAPADAVTDMSKRLVSMAKTMDTTDGK
jgi:hypothetical protein